MRIGLDMLAVQSPRRGDLWLGRYVGRLVDALLALDRGHEFVLYAYEGLPSDRIPAAPNATLEWLRSEAVHNDSEVADAMDRRVRTNPDGLDALLILSPFASWADFRPPGQWPEGPALAVIIDDLSPFLSPGGRGRDASVMLEWKYRILRTLMRYDAFLTITQATRRECQSLLGLADDRVVAIGGAANERVFARDERMLISESSRRVLEDLGIDRPFVLNVGGMEERRNVAGLIEAFARLPEKLRRAHRLVLTFESSNEERERIRALAESLGLGSAVVVTGPVSEGAIRVLYQGCAAFAFPSSYEGAGLPLLEAMQCGAPVLAGANTAQAEIVGDAGLLVNASDPTDVSEKLARLLGDKGLAQTLGDRAAARVGLLSWEHTAGQALEALERAAATRPGWRRRPFAGRRTPDKPRIALFSPLPPRKSGISDYAAALIRELRHTYAIDFYHDAGYVPDPALASSEFEYRDARSFKRYAPVSDYHAILYQMGNSWYHDFMYDTMLHYPGVVTLHDFCLVGFHLQYAWRRRHGKEWVLEELLRWYPEHAKAIRSRWNEWPLDWDLIARECAKRNWFLNRRLFDRARCVVVHSPWCVGQARATCPEYADRAVVIPLGATPRRISADERAAIRARFHIPPDALMVASFGFVHPGKMSCEALEAFKSVAQSDPSALFVFVGQEADNGVTRSRVEVLNLSDRVRFLGRTTIGDFADLAAATDIGVNLRMPPTNGETSAALLDLLSSGVATIVTDVGTFSDFPSHAVRKVRWESDGNEGLGQAFRELAFDGEARAALGRAAREYVTEHHEWSCVAKQYIDVIERCHREQTAAPRDGRRPASRVA